MNPGLVVKLRPAGPWRIGPDTGARNRVDVIYHSDSLYSAVTSAMSRMGWLEEWLEDTARKESPSVCFSSCFPFVDEIGLIIPPRSIWPPTSPALLAARVRWKSARFVPLGIVQALLDGQTLDESHWSVDGASECLVPAGRPGPFRTSMRSNAAVDRLSGSTERHATACIEFRAGSGLWAIVSFADEAAHSRWIDRLKAAFRLLADSGFGGERSRGWGRSESPEFVDGVLPEMIYGGRPAVVEAVGGAGVGEITEGEAEVLAPTEIAALETGSAESGVAETGSAPPQPAEPEPGPDVVPGQPGEPEPEPPPPDPEPGGEPVPPLPSPVPGPDVLPQLAETASEELPIPAPESPAPDASQEVVAESAAELAVETPEPPVAEPPAVESSAPEPPARETVAAEPAPERWPQAPVAPAIPGCKPHWVLSLFTPASSDTVDWRRGDYALVARSGRVDSPAGSGDLKKLVQMVAEGSVLYAAGTPQGFAPDVAPDGFPHPVFRAGFAVFIPLPEVG